MSAMVLYTVQQVSRALGFNSAQLLGSISSLGIFIQLPLFPSRLQPNTLLPMARVWTWNRNRTILLTRSTAMTVSGLPSFDRLLK